ncbi:MAG TPA: sulfatase [Candidatus Binatia bacterium]|jgi:arylsulfatase A-like enzyme
MRRYRCIPTLAVVALLATSCERPAALPAPPVRKGFPIVFLLIDALRADRIDDEERLRHVAPSLAALSQDGVRFRSAFSSAPKTIPSVPQIFTSNLFPDLHHDVSLLSLLQAAGYSRTGAFIHNPYVTKWLGRLSPTFEQLSGGDFDATRLTDDAIAWLGNAAADPFFLYVHYLDVHTPLNPPEDVARRFVDPDYKGPIGLSFNDMAGAWAGTYNAGDQRRIGQLYDASLAATDASIGRLLGALRSAGLYDKALIIVTADHGEELWDHGGFFHGQSLYDELLHVPLLVKFPGAWGGGRDVETLVRSVDLLPTVVDLLQRAGSAAAGAPLDGESLIPAVTGQAPPRTLFATVARIDDRSPPLHAVRTASAKLIVDQRSGQEQLFDLARDPGERDNIAGHADAHPLLEDLRGRLARFLEPLQSSGIHVRLVNGTGARLTYRIILRSRPAGPFVNLSRVDMEDGDRIGQNAGADGILMEGALAPGDEDEMRLDVLVPDGIVTTAIEVDPSGTPVETCAGTEAACVPVTSQRVALEPARVTTNATPARAADSSLQVRVWRIPAASTPILPNLSAADRERLRALGYAE